MQMLLCRLWESLLANEQGIYIIFEQIKERNLEAYQQKMMGNWHISAVGVIDNQLFLNYRTQLPPPFASKKPAEFNKQNMIPYFKEVQALWELKINKQHYQFKADGALLMNKEETNWAISEFRVDGTYTYQGNKFQQMPDSKGTFEIKLDEQGLPCIYLSDAGFEMAPFQVHRFNKHFIGFANTEMKGRQTDWLFRLP